MDITVKYDVNDISAELLSDVKTAVTREVTAEVYKITKAFENGINRFTDELAAVLDVRDEKQHARIKRAVTRNLDRWIKGGQK